MKQLQLKNISAQIGGKPILKNINLTVKQGEIVLILGPNGHGKSTLFKTILHHYSTTVTGGQILIDDVDIQDWTTDQIARAGIYLAMQHPVEIPGLKLLDLLRSELGAEARTSTMQLYKLLNDKMRQLNMDPTLLGRSINENFSGGERKKTEILQLEVLNPDLILLDEIDSGLDADAIQAISTVLKTTQKAILYISHNDKLSLNLVPNRVLIMLNGEIVQEGGPELIQKVQQMGYHWLEPSDPIPPPGQTLKPNGFLDGENDELFTQLKGFACGSKH